VSRGASGARSGVSGGPPSRFGAPLQLSGVGVAIGAGLGVLAGAVTGEIGTGVGFGAAAGFVVGAVLDGIRFRRYH
jgi:hypothetical protein